MKENIRDLSKSEAEAIFGGDKSYDWVIIDGVRVKIVVKE